MAFRVARQNVFALRRQFTTSVCLRAAAPAANSTQKQAPDPTPIGGSSIPFSAPKSESMDEEGSFTNSSFPNEPEPKEETASPPIIPAPNASAKHTSTTQAPAESPAPHTRGEGRVYTAAGSATLPGGGPSSVQNDLNVSEDHDLDESVGQGEENRGIGHFQTFAEKAAQSASSPEQMQENIQKAVEVAKEELSARSSSLLESLEERSGIKIPKLLDPITTDGKAEEFEWQDRDLDESERRGVYVLAGLFAGGWLLAGLGKPRKPKKGRL